MMGRAGTREVWPGGGPVGWVSPYVEKSVGAAGAVSRGCRGVGGPSTLAGHACALWLSVVCGRCSRAPSLSRGRCDRGVVTADTCATRLTVSVDAPAAGGRRAARPARTLVVLRAD